MRFSEAIGRIVRKAVEKVLNEGDFDISTFFHLDDVSIEDIRSQYVDLSILAELSNYEGKFNVKGRRIIKEEAQSTLSVEETKEFMKRRFGFKDWQFKTLKTSNGVRVFILFPSIFRNKKIVASAMESCGWTMAYTRYDIFEKMFWRTMSFDPMFQDNVHNEMRRYRYLYHWTPEYNLPSIESGGLEPRSQNGIYSYPNRLHLIKGNVPQEELLSIGETLCRKNKDKRNNGRYVLLGVATKDIPETMEIYLDPRYKYGYYTKETIPPSNVKLILRYDFSKEED